jgi:hypothetical protein
MVFVRFREALNLLSDILAERAIPRRTSHARTTGLNLYPKFV